MILFNHSFFFTARQFFGINLLNTTSLLELVVRFLFNLLVIIIIVRFLYYAVARRKDYMFTYILISSTVFILAYLLENVTLQLGFALGLFAIFGILRYRTSTIPIKEMTYLFVVIGISIINALSNNSISFFELLFTNIAMILITWGLESFWLQRHEIYKTIIYNNLELIKPGNKEKLYKDLEEKTGLTITRVEIGEINYSKNCVKLKIYFTGDKESLHLNDRNNTSSLEYHEE
jgi:hypothetical protein